MKVLFVTIRAAAPAFKKEPLFWEVRFYSIALVVAEGYSELHTWIAHVMIDSLQLQGSELNPP